MVLMDQLSVEEFRILSSHRSDVHVRPPIGALVSASPESPDLSTDSRGAVPSERFHASQRDQWIVGNRAYSIDRHGWSSGKYPGSERRIDFGLRRDDLKRGPADSWKGEI